MGRGAALSDSRHSRHRSESGTVRRSTQGCSEASAVQAVRQRMYAGTPHRRAHGFLRGFMRSILQLRTPQVSVGDQHQLGGLNEKASAETAPSVVRFRDPQIEMAHGAGGKASRRLVEGMFAPLLFANREPLGDAAIVTIGGARV